MSRQKLAITGTLIAAAVSVGAFASFDILNDIRLRAV